MEWVYDNDYDSFSLEIGEYIDSRGILLADITEAVYMVKERPEDPDVDAKVTLTIGSGLTITAGATELDASIKATFSSGDFGLPGMVLGQKYYTGLGIKIAGMLKFLEITPVDNRLKLTQDFIHD